jgi:thiamine kinase-like enzyme
MSQSIAEQFEKVKVIYQREITEQKVVRTLDELPISYELISDEWLTKAICGNTPGAEVVSHRLDVADEGTSNRRGIFLEYNRAGNDAGLPPKIFCKATQSLEARFVLGLNRCTEGETIFYNNIRPLLDIEAPVALFANVDRESLNSILLLEDVADKVTFCDHKTPINFEQARNQVELLAKLHGFFYNNPEKCQLLDMYLTFEEWADITEEGINWSEGRIRGFLAGKEVIPPRLFARADEVDPLTVKAFHSHAQLPRTMVHGDTHLKNWYITKDGNMGLGDWQVGARGCGLRDLAYVIATSLAIEDRRAWEDQLVRHYLDCLEKEGGSPLTFDETWQVYRQQMLCALAMWTFTLSPAPGAPEMQPPETSLAFINRISHAVDDLASLDSF